MQEGHDLSAKHLLRFAQVRFVLHAFFEALDLLFV